MFYSPKSGSKNTTSTEKYIYAYYMFTCITVFISSLFT